MVLYLSCWKTIKESFIVEPVTVFINMIMSRLLIDFNFQKVTVNLDSFEQVLCFNHVLCLLVYDSLQLGDALMQFR